MATRLVAALALILLTASAASAQSPRQAMQQDPACQSLTPVSAGGVAPKGQDTVAIRWLGHTNYEVA